MGSAMRKTYMIQYGAGGKKIRDAAGRRGKCGREKPPAAKPSVFELLTFTSEREKRIG